MKFLENTGLRLFAIVSFLILSIIGILTLLVIIPAKLLLRTFRPEKISLRERKMDDSLLSSSTDP